MTRIVTAVLAAAVCVALAGCGDEKPATAPSSPSPSELFDNKQPPRGEKGKTGAG
jgi:hypothetical protein